MLDQTKMGSHLIRATITGLMEEIVSKVKFENWIEFRYREEHYILCQHYFADKGPYSQSCGFSSSHVWMWELDKEGWMPKIWCFWIVVLEKTLESPRMPRTAGRLNQSILKEINPEYSLEGLMWSSNTLATWCKETTHWKRLWCWERLKAGGEGDDRGQDGWMASSTQWAWVWASSGRWWRTGKPGVLQSTGSQRIGHEWLSDYNNSNKEEGIIIIINPIY